MFLPASGYWGDNGKSTEWRAGGNGGYYWPSKHDNEDGAYFLCFHHGDDIDVDNFDSKSDFYYSSRLVRE